MKQNLIAFVAALVMASAAFGQTGVSFQTPKIESQVPQPIAGLTGVVCLDTALGTPCAPPVSVFSDKALNTPITLTTDGDGMFPTFFIAPGQYQWCASDILGRIAAYCTKFTAPAASGSSPTFAAITVTGNSALNGNVSVGGAATLTGQLNANATARFKGPVPWYDVLANGLKCDWPSPATDDTVALQTLVNNVCTSPGAGRLFIPLGSSCRLTAQITIPCEVKLEGEVANGGAFGAGSFIVDDRVAPAATQGLFNWNGNNFLTQGIGGGIDHLVIWRAVTRTAGTAVSLTATDCNHRPGHMTFNDLRVTGDGTYSHALFIDGTLCATAGTQGIRDVTLVNFQPFQTTVDAMLLKNAVHFYWYGATTSPTGGGNADINVDGGGTALSNSTDVLLSGSISGNLNLDHADRVRCSGCYVSGNITSTVNTTNSYFDGMVDNSTPGVGNGFAYSTNDPVATASLNATRVNALRSQTWLLTGGTVPSGIASGDIISGQGATTGTVKLGTDNNMLWRRNNGSGAGSQVCQSFDGLSTTPFCFDNVNGFINTKPESAAAYKTATNCSSSGGTCAAAPAGSVSIAAAATTVTVSTTAVTANSQILVTRDDSLGTKLSVTCNTQSSLVLGAPRVTARTGGTSFVITIDAGPTTNPMCLSYSVVN